MRSIRRRAGCSSLEKKSGSAIATRKVGICRRANHTRRLAGSRSSVRMLWNSKATNSMVARSAGVAAACFSSVWRSRRSRISADGDGSARTSPVEDGPARWTRRSCACAMASARRAEAGRAFEVSLKPGRWRSITSLNCPNITSVR